MQSSEDLWKDNQVWLEWGRKLFLEHPNGLGDEPDFCSDGNELYIWSHNGFFKFQEQMWKFGEFENYRVGEKSFQRYPEDSREDQIHIAQTAFGIAKVYWRYAKADADENAKEELKIRHEAEDQEKQLEALRSEVAAADTMQALEIRERDIRDRLAGNNDVHLHHQLDVVQTRLIEIERLSARGNWRWAVAGFVVGFLGLVVGVGFPVWDIMHRVEQAPQRDCPTISNNPAAKEMPALVQPKQTN